jgi:hypothetical protein
MKVKITSINEFEDLGKKGNLWGFGLLKAAIELMDEK